MRPHPSYPELVVYHFADDSSHSLGVYNVLRTGADEQLLFRATSNNFTYNRTRMDITADSVVFCATPHGICSAAIGTDTASWLSYRNTVPTPSEPSTCAMSTNGRIKEQLQDLWVIGFEDGGIAALRYQDRVIAQSEKIV